MIFFFSSFRFYFSFPSANDFLRWGTNSSATVFNEMRKSLSFQSFIHVDIYLSLKHIICWRNAFCAFAMCCARFVSVVTLRRRYKDSLSLGKRNTLKDIMKVCKFKLFTSLYGLAHAMTKSRWEKNASVKVLDLFDFSFNKLNFFNFKFQNEWI